MGGGGRQPHPRASPARPRTRWSTAPAWPPCPPAPWACPVRLDIPGEGRRAGVTGSLPLSLPCSASPCSIRPPGGALTPQQLITGAVPLRARGWAEGAPPAHLGVDADGADGRDLKIVTCEGRRGRGARGALRTHSRGLCPGVCLQPPPVPQAPSPLGVTSPESCLVNAPCHRPANGRDPGEGL